MEANKKTILIPTDFTDTAELAIRYGTDLAKILGLDVVLLHIFENIPANEAMRKMIRSQFVFRDAANRLKERADSITNDDGVNATAQIVEGNIFEHIGESATKFNSAMIVMGTHGKKGVQHVLGSFAARVIESTPVPILTIQAGVEDNQADWFKRDMVVVCDIWTDMDQVRSWGEYIGKALGTRVHLVDVAMEEAVELGTYGQRIQQAREDLSGKLGDLVYERIVCPEENIAGEIIEYANENKAGMVFLSQRPDGDKHVLGEQAKKILVNGSKTPVICFDSKKTQAPG